ncbi:MAG: dienelactone hydrolase family protein [Bacteroidetes bacterium]|nr:MAG: dienelactone hydrolase family protein [Bacteroidota bacterium]
MKITLYNLVMKNIIGLLLLSSFFACQNQEAPIPMCHDPNAAFAAFASDRAFRDMHPVPQPVAVTHTGKEIEFPVEGGPNGHGYLAWSSTQTNQYLLLFHEWWGLNDYIRNETVKWAHDLNINVLAVDLYDGKSATTPEEAGKLIQSCDQARARAIIAGAARFAGKNAEFSTMGWCFGGGWSLQAALELGAQVKACVVFYGMPESDVAKLETLSADVLMVHAKKDKWINDEVVQTFRENMKAAGKTLTVEEFDADHAFANPSSPRYNDAAARDARAKVLTYLKNK